MYIERVREITDEIFTAILQLVPLLGSHKTLPTHAELIALINSEASTLWVARYPDQTGRIVGMLTISVYQVPTGLRPIVEDVVVDPEFRQRGIAKALMQTAIEFAREAGV